MNTKPDYAETHNGRLIELFVGYGDQQTRWCVASREGSPMALGFDTRDDATDVLPSLASFLASDGLDSMPDRYGPGRPYERVTLTLTNNQVAWLAACVDAARHDGAISREERTMLRGLLGATDGRDA